MNIPDLERKAAELLGPGSLHSPQPALVAVLVAVDQPVHLCPSFLATKRMQGGSPRVTPSLLPYAGQPVDGLIRARVSLCTVHMLH